MIGGGWGVWVVLLGGVTGVRLDEGGRTVSRGHNRSEATVIIIIARNVRICQFLIIFRKINLELRLNKMYTYRA